MRSTAQKTLMAASSLAALLALGACGQRDTGLEQRTGSAADRAEQRTQQAGRDVRQETREAREESRDTATNVMGAGSAAIDDAQIVTKVNAGLAADKDLSALRIDVDSKNGVVTLTGSVPNTAAKQRATSIAKNVKDVKDVENQLNVTTG